MSFRVLQTNIAAYQAQRRVAEVSSEVNRSFERLSSGLRINRASDDAAGLSIATTLRADARVLTQATRNVNDAISMYNIADGATSELSSILIRIGELASQSANGVLSNTQRRALDKEGQALRREFNRIIEITEFNNMQLLTGEAETVDIQMGYDFVNLQLADLATSYVGDGTFEGPVDIGVHPFSGGQVGDLDGDGINDYVRGTGATIQVYLGTGDATYFSAPVGYNLTSGTEWIELRDFNNDGVLDVFTADQAADTLAVQLGNGDGTFKAQLVKATPDLGPHTSLVDINGDSYLDLLYTENTSGLNVALGVGDGTFGAITAYAGQEDGHLAIADINGDGDVDLVGASANYGSTFVRLGNGDGTFKTTTGIGGRGDEAYFSDVNGDGNLDLVGGAYDSPAWLLVSLGTGTGAFGAATQYQVADWSRLHGVIDLNGDGFDDAIFSSYGDDSMSVFLGNGDGSYKAPASYASGGSYVLRFGDIDNDGVTDVINDDGEIFFGNGQTIAALAAFDLSTQVDALDAVEEIRSSLQSLAKVRGEIGSSVSRLEVAASTLRVRTENYEAAASQILDVDVATEAARLARLNILQQAATSVLAQANQLPALALTLLSD